MPSNARKLAVVLNPEDTITYACHNRACERYKKPTPVLVPAGADDAKHYRGSRGPRLAMAPDPLFPLPEREPVDDGLSCYACGQALSPVHAPPPHCPGSGWVWQGGRFKYCAQCGFEP